LWSSGHDENRRRHSAQVALCRSAGARTSTVAYVASVETRGRITE
jgi:hypothetical protein